MRSPTPVRSSARPAGTAGNAKEDEAASLQLILSVGRSFKYVDDYVRPRMQKLGFTMTEFSVLTVLYHGGPTPLGVLSQRILLTGASTTYTVKKLERRGLLTRRPMPEDLRVIMGEITEKGRAQLDRILPLHTQDLAAAMRNLSVAEKRKVAKLLNKLRGTANFDR